MSFVSTGEWARDSMLSMSKTFRPWDVDQVWLLPPSVQDLVPAGHVAHFVRDTVRSGLDLSAIMAGYGEDRGYPPYHPGMMTALTEMSRCRPALFGSCLAGVWWGFPGRPRGRR